MRILYFLSQQVGVKGKAVGGGRIYVREIGSVAWKEFVDYKAFRKVFLKLRECSPFIKILPKVKRGPGEQYTNFGQEKYIFIKHLLAFYGFIEALLLHICPPNLSTVHYLLRIIGDSCHWVALSQENCDLGFVWKGFKIEYIKID